MSQTLVFTGFKKNTFYAQIIACNFTVLALFMC